MDKEVFNKNNDALREKYKDVYEDLLVFYETQEPTDEQFVDVSLYETREKEKALVVKMSEREIWMNSKYYPMKTAKQWASQFEYHHISTNVIIYGIGNGIYVRSLLENIQEETCVLIIEPNFSVFSKIIEKIDLSDIILNDSVELLFFHRGKEEISNKLYYLMAWSNLETTIRTVHPGYDKIFSDVYEEYQIVMNRILEKIIVRENTMVAYSESAVYNVINNMQYIKRSNYLTELVGIFPDNYPAVIVAAGPSLKKNMQILFEMKDKAFVIVVDTAVKVLEENHIPYDAIAIIDPEKPAEFLTEYPNCAEKPLFCPSVAPSSVMSFHKGRKIWISDSIWIEKEYKKIGLENISYCSGGSVATAATEIARILGIKTIILIGQDLAYLGEQTHAGRDYAMGEERGFASQWVDGIGGNKVRTRWDWIYFLHWYEEFVQKNSDITLIDATEGGALIHGSEVLSFEEAKKKYTGEYFCFKDFLEKLPYTFEVYDYQPILQDILKMKEEMSELSKKCKSAIHDLEIFDAEEKNTSLEELDKVLLKCVKINQFIAQIEGDELIELGTSRLLRDKLDKVNYISKDQRTDKKNTAKMLKDYYNAVVEVSEKIMKYFSKLNLEV